MDQYSKTAINVFVASLLVFFPYLTIASSSRNITAIFCFGDSSIDTGNNNYLHTAVRADHPPYGRDFPFHIPAGRFSNGKLVIDMITEFLALKKLLPPYLSAKVTAIELLSGVCFGSAGSGLDPLTGQASNVLSVADQINLFDKALTRIRKLVGPERANSTVTHGLFFFATSTNDFLAYYNSSQRAMEFNISGYQNFIIRKYEDAIRSLYTRGARKFIVTGLEPIGCLPIQITVKNITPRRCIDQQNLDSTAFNEKLKQLVSRLETQLQDIRVAYYDVYDILLDMVNNPANYGYEETLKGCCGTGLLEYGPTCSSITPTCQNASKYLFWDAVHPSLAAYTRLAKLARQTVIKPYVTAL